MGKYRSYSAEFKVQVVLEALKGQKTEAQLCREHNIAPDLLTHWKQNLLERAPQVFQTKQQSQKSVCC
jgi:transposase-like protein